MSVTVERTAVAGHGPVILHYTAPDPESKIGASGEQTTRRAYMRDVWITHLNGVPQWITGIMSNGREHLTPWRRVVHLEIEP